MQKFLRKFVAIVMVLCLTVSTVIVARAEELRQDEMVAARIVFEALEADIAWDADEESITITMPTGLVFRFWVSRSYMEAEGVQVPLEHGLRLIGTSVYFSMSDLLLFVEVLEELTETEHLGHTTTHMLAIGEVLMDMLNLAGLVISIVDVYNDFEWIAGFGYADTENEVSVSADTLFNVASISKVFTAIAVMQLVEDGTIGLDDYISELLPGFYASQDMITGEGDYTGITVRMLLSHTSGLVPDISPSGVITAYAPEGGFMRDFVENLADFQMIFPQATAFSYANNNFTLLGIMLAELLGYEDVFYGFESLMQTNVLEPLGMDMSAFILDESHMPYLALNYQTADLQEEVLFYNFLPTGGLVTSAADMNRFMRAVLQGGAIEGNRVLDAGTIDSMFTPQNFDFSAAPPVFANIRPGLGFLLAEELNGFTHWGHGGTVIHHHSHFALDTRHGIGVFVATNTTTGLGLTPSALASFVLQSAIEEIGGDTRLPEPDEYVEPIELELEELLAFEGFYMITGISDNLLRVEASEDGILYMHNFPGLDIPLELTPLSDGSFVNMELPTLRMWFDDSFDEMLIFLGEFRSMHFATRVDASMLRVPGGFSDWLGVYEVVLAEPHHRSVTQSLTIGIDPEFGFGYVRTVTRHGLNPFAPFFYAGDGNFIGQMEFENVGGVRRIRFGGQIFERTGE